MTDKPPLNVHQALSAVMGSVQGVSKRDRNQQQGFSFRGIDAVMNAVGPAFREHGVVCIPSMADVVSEEKYQSTKGAQMTRVVVRIVWTFVGPDGSVLLAQSLGEAADSGDKVISKAHSVAYRTVLLQALCIPTDEPDADASSHERAATPRPAVKAPTDPLRAAKEAVAAAGKAKGLSIADLADEFAMWSQGEVMAEADSDTLQKFAAYISEAATA